MKGKWTARALGSIAALGALGALVVASGVVPVKASSGHWALTEWVLHTAMQRSVATHSLTIDVPELDDPALVLVGAGHYESGCRFCHGAPGSRPPRVPHHMTPHPPDLSQVARKYDSAELFYIVLHGIKMTGMPAWPARGREDEVWAVVAFLQQLPTLDPAAYAELVFGAEDTRLRPAPRPVGEPIPTETVPSLSTAPTVVVEQCARCHGIDGLGRGADAFPRLAGQRAEYLEGALDAYAHGKRSSGIMEPIAATLDLKAIQQAAGWYSRRPAPSWTPGGDPGRSIALRGIPSRRIPACADCHGPSKREAHPGYPLLGGQSRAYLVRQLQLFTNGQRGGTQYAHIMREAVTEHDLRPKEMEAVAQYYAGLPGSP